MSPIFPAKGQNVSMTEWQKHLVAGDHIFVSMTDNLAYHHGIYVGEGKVIDFNPDKSNGETKGFLSQGQIKERTIEEFTSCASNSYIGRIIYDNDSEEKRKKALELAERFCGERPPYNLALSNCESFATYCWTEMYVNPYDNTKTIQKYMSFPIPEKKF